MSINFYEIHLQTDNVNEVQKYLAYWLNGLYREKPEIKSNQQAEIDFFQKEYPSCFAVGSLHKNWVTIRHDSYEQQVSLANKLSQVFSATAIQAMGQSTVDTYYLSVHQNGKIVRKFYSGEDVEKPEQEGKPFSFEQPFPDSEDYQYDYEDMQSFCKNFGIDLLTDAFEHQNIWTLINIKEKPIPEQRSFSEKIKSFFGRADRQ
ncbi:hypothetical protein D1B31_07995 [Neobacillus notoginsengisoli]|uniref:Uncharacterized protein n=1 Tax=Neobacillus notoginsengisoli TaxID=1578198 RepID=A0A417YW59_9BACI|nr:hypothetical protein [Neobacillus notoginsengisoli]RHW41649.1 hypothetical protein D1B31_07995 [Neobacillus notoginsengisoli]